MHAVTWVRSAIDPLTMFAAVAENAHYYNNINNCNSIKLMTL